MTNKKYANLTGASPATAQRDLADLVAKVTWSRAAPVAPRDELKSG